ncbi:hypothetical protein WJX81_004822 [Elliptochloris bilobata]|uniref:Centrosomal protein of 44 kDa n=1 Tax=Elliptochloris bilobata TaxID=381761 RepID=A0AAW1SL58_9CHLO
MATGDILGNVERLRADLKHIKYPLEVDLGGLRTGDPAAILPIIHYVLLRFSRHVALDVAASGYELQGKTDARFLEAVLKLARDHFGLKPVLTCGQFLEQGFAERKVLFLHSLIQTAKERHNAEVRRQRLAAAAPPRLLSPRSRGKENQAVPRGDGGAPPGKRASLGVRGQVAAGQQGNASVSATVQAVPQGWAPAGAASAIGELVGGLERRLAAAEAAAAAAADEAAEAARRASAADAAAAVARSERSALAARLTVVEGRLRFLEAGDPGGMAGQDPDAGGMSSPLPDGAGSHREVGGSFITL